MDTLQRTASVIHDAFVYNTCGAYEMRGLVIGWCVLVVGLAADATRRKLKSDRRGKRRP